MDTHVDLRVAELLASRLCHDLVSPIGAVSNGMELLEEDPDPEMIADAVRLSSGSARQALAVVQFYRLAYGRAGQRLDVGAAELRRLSADFLAPHKTALVWNADDLDAAPAGSGKLLLNTLALAMEALPRGGQLSAAVETGAPTRLCVTATGRDAGLRAESRQALDDGTDPGDLTARTVQGYFTRVLARRMDGDLSVGEPEPGETADDSRLVFEVAIPGN